MAHFSRETIIEAVNAFEFRTHAPITKFMLRFNIGEPPAGGGVEPRTVHIIEVLMGRLNSKGPRGGDLMYEVIEHLLETRLQPDRWGEEPNPEELFPALVRALRQDGYVIEGTELRTMLPETVPLVETLDQLTALLEHYGFGDAQGHLEQARSAHTRGEWASCNAQLRSFVESLFDAIYDELAPVGMPRPGTSHLRRQELSQMNPPFLRTDLNEWLEGNRRGFVQGFWERLHAHGSHPGLSDEEDSTFRLHLVLIVAGHYLRRLDTRLRGGGAP